MNLALLLLQGNEPVDFDELIGKVVRIGIIALFFLGPALKSIFGKKKKAPVTTRRQRATISKPVAPAPVPVVVKRPVPVIVKQPAPAEPWDEAECYEEDLEQGWGRPKSLESQPELSLEDELARMPEPVADSIDRLEGAVPLAAHLVPRKGVMNEDSHYALPHARGRSGFPTTPAGWRSALIMREVLGPPVGLRSQNADRAPFG